MTHLFSVGILITRQPLCRKAKLALSVLFLAWPLRQLALVPPCFAISRVIISPPQMRDFPYTTRSSADFANCITIFGNPPRTKPSAPAHSAEASYYAVTILPRSSPNLAS
ncbi:hypothetical protein F4678DRAFT_445252 [Xylaria arbuscula]|nr:hypothetical protein F4678DRAFT_445252 [Xylaria arbuscula]